MNVEVAEAAARELGVVFIGVAPGGASGSVFVVCDHRGAEWMLKFVDDPLDVAATRVSLVNRLHELKYPTGLFQAPVKTIAGIALMQQRIAGAHRETLTLPMAQEMVRLSNLHANAALDAGLPDFGEVLRTSLSHGLTGYCEHAPLKAYSVESRHLHDWLHEVGARARNVQVPSCDVVHYDFHHWNVLWAGDRATVVFDWDACQAGDRWFDAVTLVVDAIGHADDEVIEWLKSELVRNVPIDRLRLYFAHMLLRLAHWNIVHVPERAPIRLSQTTGWVSWLETL